MLSVKPPIVLADSLGQPKPAKPIRLCQSIFEFHFSARLYPASIFLSWRSLPRSRTKTNQRAPATSFTGGAGDPAHALFVQRQRAESEFVMPTRSTSLFILIVPC